MNEPPVRSIDAKLSNVTLTALYDRVESFVTTAVRDYLADADLEQQYPNVLVDAMSQLGLFGVSVRREFGGAGLGPDATIEVNRSLSRGWQSLSALLGTHFRVCLYIQQCGTREQQERWLPTLASGERQTAHAFNEQGIKELSRFRTTISYDGPQAILNGHKAWCTNARNTRFMIVIARVDDARLAPGTVAVVIDPTRDGAVIGDELPRPGIKGISLCPVRFTNYRVDPERDFIGGADCRVDEFIETFAPGSSLGFAARAVGAAEAATSDLASYLQARTTETSWRPGEVLAYRYAEIQTRLRAMLAMLSDAQRPGEDRALRAHMTKVFCTDQLQQLVRDCMMLKGGASYSDESTVMSRIYRDAISLMLIDTPNDILLSRVGTHLLGHPSRTM